MYFILKYFHVLYNQNDERECVKYLAKEQKETHKSVARMLCIDVLRHCTVEKQGVKDFLAQKIPAYKPPSRTTISRTYVPNLF